LKEAKRFLQEKDHFAKHAGIELLVVEAGYAKARMEIRDFHLNGANIVHGGAIFTMADFVFAAAVNSHDQIAVGINASISYVKAATTGVLVAEAKEISLNRKLGNYIVEIRDEQDDLIAVFQGTAYRTTKKHQWAEGGLPLP
jgi:acyl-CoA thioesterase